MRITTVQELNSDTFDKKVNTLLKTGWRLHGTPTIQTVAHQDSWEGKLRSYTSTTFIQVMVTDN